MRASDLLGTMRLKTLSSWKGSCSALLLSMRDSDPSKQSQIDLSMEECCKSNIAENVEGQIRLRAEEWPSRLGDGCNQQIHKKRMKERQDI